MSSRAPSSASRPVVPERYGWSLRVVSVGAVVYGGIGVVQLLAQTADLVAMTEPGARVAVTLPISYVLPTNGSQNSYGGVPFVRDGTPVTATAVSSTLSGVPVAGRIGLAAVPILWTLTALLVTVCLALAVHRLQRGTPFGRGSARPVAAAALTLAVGSSFAQILQGIADLGVRTFAWAAPDGDSPAARALRRLLLRARAALLRGRPARRRAAAPANAAAAARDRRAGPVDGSAIHCRLDELLADRGLTLARLSELV